MTTLIDTYYLQQTHTSKADLNQRGRGHSVKEKNSKGLSHVVSLGTIRKPTGIDGLISMLIIKGMLWLLGIC